MATPGMPSTTAGIMMLVEKKPSQPWVGRMPSFREKMSRANGNGEEYVHGLADQGEGHHCAVPPGALAEGGEKPGSHAQGNGNQERGKVKLGGDPDLALEQVRHAPPPVLVAFSEVAAQGISHVPCVLYGYRVIQSLLGADSFVGVLPEILPQ